MSLAAGKRFLGLNVIYRLHSNVGAKNHNFNIGIKHVFPCIYVCQVPRELLKTEAEDFEISRVDCISKENYYSKVDSKTKKE